MKTKIKLLYIVMDALFKFLLERVNGFVKFVDSIVFLVELG